MKKGIRYLRYSSDGQSNSSIERQDIYTASWFDRSDTQIVDTFIDEGYSAKTFDRPDFKKLMEFVAKHHRTVDYLVVDQMDRFSRDAGEALVMIKNLQKKYAIQIVSANDGLIYDQHTPGSLLRTGLQFLLAEENNIDRTQKIRAGIYTAKAKEGRYIGGHPPFGYTKEGKGKERHLVIHPDQAPVIRYIYESYLTGTPLYIIYKEARAKGFTGKGNSVISNILTNAIYAGHQQVEGHKHMPGGLFPAIHEAIIDMHTWQQVQKKINGPVKTKTIIADDLPLRGVLKCHCNQPLTGAASKGKAKWYNYYKCNKPGHNNISAIKAHDQLQEILNLLSLEEEMVEQILAYSKEAMQEKMKENKQQLQQCKRELEQEEKKLLSVEEKWIQNQVTHETYSRWYSDITNKRISLKARIETLSRDEEEQWMLMYGQLEKLTDLRYLYNRIATTEKQELLRLVFDNGLYYQSSLYRTPYLMETFTHNSLKLKQQQLLIIDGWDYQINDTPPRWSWRESNPRPNIFVKSFLHAYFIIACRR